VEPIRARWESLHVIVDRPHARGGLSGEHRRSSGRDDGDVCGMLESRLSNAIVNDRPAGAARQLLSKLKC
jgi:hypothetical protein